MATTKNRKITVSLKYAIDYAMNDKVEDAPKDDIRDSVAYAIDDKTGKVIYPTYFTTMNCKPGHPVNTFNQVIEEYGKSELEKGSARTKDGAPILAWRYYQNFEGHVDPIVANEIGQKLASEVFSNYPVVIGTHTNTENTHNHIIVCAWNLDGKKWHQHNAAYRHVREVSDRLCEEYGLSVLMDTRKQKLLKWTDEQGQVHYYEPTPRKNKLIAKREAGEITTDDVGSYRNTIPYEKVISKEKSNRDTVKKDIDRLLPFAKSYEHLVEMLRNIGYVVNDKRKNGDWLKHISYQPPTADKATRDYKIEDSGFYLRENLEKVIAEFNADREEKKLSETSDMPPFFEEYIYGEVSLKDIDDRVRTIKENDGTYSVVQRGETERAVIRDIRVKDSELRLLDTSRLDMAIQEHEKKQKHSGGYSNHQKAEIIQAQIKESFHVLRFMERQSLYSQQQINAIIESTWDKYNECMKNLDTLEGLVARLESVLQVPKKMEIIEDRMERMKGNRDYTDSELEGDLQQLKTYRAIEQRFKLSNPESVEQLSSRVLQSKAKISQLQKMLSAHRERLIEYDRCVNVLSRIDKEQGRDNTEIMVQYQKIKQEGDAQAKRTEEQRNKRRMAER